MSDSEQGTSIELFEAYPEVGRTSVLVPFTDGLTPPDTIGHIPKDIVTHTLAAVTPALRRTQLNPAEEGRFVVYEPPYTKGVLVYGNDRNPDRRTGDPENTATMRVIPIDTLWLPEGEEELATGMANFVVKRNAARKENGGTLALDSRFGGIDPAKPKEAGSLLLYRIGLAQQIGATTLGDLVSTGLFDQTVVRVLAMELMSFIKDVDTLNTSAKLIQVMDTAGTAMRGLVKAAQDKATGFVRDNKGTLTTISFVEQNTGLSGRILNAVDHNLPTDNGSFRAQVGSPSDKTVLSLKLPFNRAFNPKDYL